MARAELMLDLAAYKQALQQARPALQAPGRDQPPPPGCRTKTQSPGWYPGLGPLRLASQPPTAVALVSRGHNHSLDILIIPSFTLLPVPQSPPLVLR